MVTMVVAVTAIISCSSPTKNEKANAENEKNKTEQPQTKASTLPAFSIMDVNGTVTNTNNFKGKKVFVNLWASWCPPCRAEIPSIEKLKTQVDSQNVAFVMLSLDKTFEVAKEFAKSGNIQLPIYYPAENLPPLFDIGGIPATFIFNENGDLVKQNNGADDYSTDEYIKLLSAE